MARWILPALLVLAACDEPIRGTSAVDLLGAGFARALSQPAGAEPVDPAALALTLLPGAEPFDP